MPQGQSRTASGKSTPREKPQTLPDWGGGRQHPPVLQGGRKEPLGISLEDVRIWLEAEADLTRLKSNYREESDEGSRRKRLLAIQEALGRGSALTAKKWVDPGNLQSDLDRRLARVSALLAEDPADERQSGGRVE